MNTAKSKSRRIPLGYGKGTIEELPSGSWRWQGPIAGKTASVTRPTRKGVIEAAERAQADGLKPTSEVTVADLLDRFLATRDVPDAPPRTVKNDRYLANAISKAIGDVMLEKLTKRVVLDGLIQPLIDKGRTKATIDQQKSMLSRACDWAVDRDEMEVNPVRLVRMPRVHVKPREKPYLRTSEVPVVIRYLTTNHSAGHALFLTILLCGLRPQEARGLLWENVDLDAAMIHVETSAEDDGTIVDRLKTDNKTNAARRSVPMPPELVAALKREKVEQLARVGRKPYVFANDKGGVFVHPRIGDLSEKISRATRLPHVPPHGYRHTFASMLHDAGMPHKQIMRLGGWTTLSMLDNYTHAMVDVPDSVAALARFLETAQ